MRTQALRADDIDRMERLRIKIDEQAEEIRQLRELVMPYKLFPRRWRLTPKQEQMLSLLLARAPMVRTMDDILRALYSSTDEPRSAKIVDVYIHKIRKALRNDGILIQTRWGVGYYIDKATADRINDLCEREKRGEDTQDARSVIIVEADYKIAESPGFEHHGVVTGPNQLAKLIGNLHAEGVKRWPQMVREDFDGYLRSIL